MRENKFRGFVEAESRWIYGDLLHNYWHLDGVVYETAIRYKINDGYSYPIPVKPDTVGQFTGLYDKDGREIYDRDLLRVHIFTKRLGENLGIVEGEKEFTCEICNQEHGLWLQGKTEQQSGYLAWFDGLHEESFSVIGNIHEHPKLLNEQK
jgi:uncharacterized phage protein (TIGR01671 family)